MNAEKRRPGWLYLWCLIIGFTLATLYALAVVPEDEPYDTIAGYLTAFLQDTVTASAIAAALMLALASATWAFIRNDPKVDLACFRRLSLAHLPALGALYAWSPLYLLATLADLNFTLLEETRPAFVYSALLQKAGSPLWLAPLALYAVLAILHSLPRSGSERARRVSAQDRNETVPS